MAQAKQFHRRSDNHNDNDRQAEYKGNMQFLIKAQVRHACLALTNTCLPRLPAPNFALFSPSILPCYHRAHHLPLHQPASILLPTSLPIHHATCSIRRYYYTPVHHACFTSTR